MNNKMTIHIYLSTIILKANRLNAPIKRYWVAEWITKQDPYICCLQETHFKSKDTHRLKVKDVKRYFMKIEMKNIWGSSIYMTK